MKISVTGSQAIVVEIDTQEECDAQTIACAIEGFLSMVTFESSVTVYYNDEV